MSNPQIVGYNFYLNGVKVNLELEDGEFTFKGLDSSTLYNLTATALDSAGRESPPSPVLPASTLQNGHAGEPMSPADSIIIDSIVNRYKVTTGVTIGITGPKGFYVKSYGTVGVDSSAPMTPDMHFRIMSITKSFTATAILMQVDAGNLSLDDTIDQYVSGIPSGNLMTIRDVMMMRSGVVHDQDNMQMLMQTVLNPTAVWSMDNTLAYIRSSGSKFTPGTSYDYTNSNYILLGYVLEAVTGRNARDILLEDIIEPLGLKETSWPTDASLPEPHPRGYWTNPLTSIPLLGGFFNNDITNLDTGHLGAAGALVSTVGDMLKWGVELRDGSLLSDEMHQVRMSTFPYSYASSPASPNFPKTYSYGLGLENMGSWFGHNGSEPGFDCCCRFEPHTGSVIVVWENSQTSAPVPLVADAQIWADIAAYLFPGSTLRPGYGAPQKIALKGISSRTRFGAGTTTTMFAPAGTLPGDADGATSLPHKVPFVLGEFQPRPDQTIDLQSISTAEDIGEPSLGNADRDAIPHAVPHQL
ncbi:hypothetical protein MINTM005_13390 [Mycobacterium intracellulare]|uniref:serine hydrolase domain-containing protein n=1 Tax=Mycobacterium intracellulare TaxID=1767 RepID=UPI001927DFE2|nr:serine hydrolase domain-containing protein [Mycobacterium intracellulare]BCO56095.1 hypothetical protein MINTM005_13390 [Mycobacterium intracellulare]